MSLKFHTSNDCGESGSPELQICNFLSRLGDRDNSPAAGAQMSAPISSSSGRASVWSYFR